jgi:hypothetical protein
MVQELPKMNNKKPHLPRKDFLDTTALIRSIQRAEGNPDCFRRAQVGCDQFDCIWRKYCLKEVQVTSSASLGSKREKATEAE